MTGIKFIINANAINTISGRPELSFNSLSKGIRNITVVNQMHSRRILINIHAPSQINQMFLNIGCIGAHLLIESRINTVLFGGKNTLDK